MCQASDLHLTWETVFLFSVLIMERAREDFNKMKHVVSGIVEELNRYPLQE